MNNQCNNFRQRTKTKDKRKTVYFYCTKQRKEITFDDCSNCPYKGYKECTKSQKYCAKTKKRSSKLAKLERNRFSLFTDNMNKCYFCPNKKDHTHEIFCGRNRQNSMKYGLCLPICESCHSKYQNNFLFNKEWHKKRTSHVQQNLS